VTFRLALVIAALLALVVGCTSDDQPELPSNTDVVAIADRVTGPEGQDFMRDITSASWNDDGRRAAELFAWIPRDAQSTDRAAADRAGKTANAIATFLADNRESFARAPANSALWQAFAQSLVPYLGVMVGDESGVAGFEPLDGPNSQMRHTAALFAAMTKNADANKTFTEAASARAQSYEEAFAKAAVAEPLLADRGAAQRPLLQAARLRSLVATGAYVADSASKKPAVAYAQTELAYQVASLTARPGDHHINPEYFKEGRLLSPSEISEADWSIYDSQLAVYLAPWPRIFDAIQQFGHTYDTIATGQ
jgi:hypothetical protein